MRALAVLLAVLALAPAAVAQSGPVDVADVAHPPTVLVDRPFPVTLNLTNRGGEAVDVHLFGAVYRPGEGECGSAAGDAFRGFTHKLQAVLHLEPGDRVQYPPAGDPPWFHVVNASAARDGPDLAFCVFAAESGEGARATLTYHDHEKSALHARTSNAPPAADFAYEPLQPRALQPVTFRADATDPDGDALTYLWDFGRYTADGRATGVGADASHAFYPHGAFTVTLTVRDAWDTTTVTRTVHVLPEAEASTEGGLLDRWVPGAGGAIVFLAVALLALAVGRRSR